MICPKCNKYELRPEFHSNRWDYAPVWECREHCGYIAVITLADLREFFEERRKQS